ncbi:MAG: GAF domain-containing protein [Deltaproteobacteria bacterium]|nr:MAG: GAF domain-containing protein [Deltaproteobacteria bacterium]
MEKENSCINCIAILDYVKASRDGDLSGLLQNLDPEIDQLSDPENFLRDPNNWVSSALVSNLFKRARMIFEDEMAAYNIARYAVENVTLGYIQRIIVKAFWSIKHGLKNLQKIDAKFSRTKRVELAEIKRNEAIVRLHWHPGMDVTKDTCLYNQGLYSFLPIIWGGKPITLREECCYFHGAPYCEYHLRWTFRNSFHEFFSKLFTSKSVLMETVKEMEEDKQVIEQKYEEVNRLNVELNQRIKQLMAIQETGKAILSVLDLEPLLDVIMSILSSVCKIHRALIMLVNEEEGCLEYIHGLGFAGEVPKEIKNYRVSLDRLSNILVRVTNTGRPEYIPDVKSSKLRRENIILTYGKPTSVYVVPLITRSKVIGVIATDAVDTDGVSKETRETLQVFAPQIAIAIENARLYSRLQEQMGELKRSHALLSRAEKFSFLGNLAARLAHEIKNPMTAIGTFIQLLPTKYEDEEFRSDFHKIAMEETARVNNLITELLDLVKPKESQFKFDDLNSLIDKMVLLVSPQTNAKKIDVIRQLDPDIGEVWIDPEKMKQVFLNLLSNAVEFTPEGGRIEISTRNLPQKEGGRNISVEIKDNGLGIPQSNMGKIFDPYFTTKHKSNMHDGTGLGLFIAYQNMQDHGGTIEVKSGVKEGTVFTLTLPSKISP